MKLKLKAQENAKGLVESIIQIRTRELSFIHP